MTTSAKDGKNVEELFQEMTKQIMDKEQKPERTECFALKASDRDQKSNCC